MIGNKAVYVSLSFVKANLKSFDLFNQVFTAADENQLYSHQQNMNDLAVRSLILFWFKVGYQNCKDLKIE